NGPMPDRWDTAYRDQKVDTMILLADADAAFLLHQTHTVLDDVAAVADVLTVEHGHVLRNEHKVAVEPFGYVDGISQPLFLQGDLKTQQASSKPLWDPSATPDPVRRPHRCAPAGPDC